MIAIDMRMPEDCKDCPFVYLTSMPGEPTVGLCRIMHYKGRTMAGCMVPDKAGERDEECPLSEIRNDYETIGRSDNGRGEKMDAGGGRFFV